MQEHQILTGSANAGNHCYSVGQVGQFTFWAYGSGCDLVISSSNQKPIQIISGNKNLLISAVTCSESNGQIAVAYGKEIVIYKPSRCAHFSTFSYKWKRHSSFSLEPDGGNATILSWNSDGDHMLVGCSVISLWSYASSYVHRPTSVTFQLHDNATTQPEEDDMQLSSWKHLWSSGIKEHPVQLSFSPTKSHDQVFASVALGECMIKVWYSCHFPNGPIQHHNVLSQPFVTDKVDFSFTYLLHPQPVTGFEWRKNFLLEGVERFANVLISSSGDQICRIWVETNQPVSRLMRFQSCQEHDTKQTRKGANDKFKKAASTPMLSHNSESSFWNPLYRKSRHTKVRHFHIAATINPLSDIPILPSIAVMQSNQNLQYDENFPVFTVHWLNNKFYQILLQYNNFVSCNGGISNLNRSFDPRETERRNTMERNTASVDFHNAEFFHNNSSRKDAELSTGMIEKLVCTWQESRDALFSIHPSDGSLLIWHVDYLDEERAGLIRQPQVCFSSRIPMVFSSGDAATLCPRLILFVNQSSEQNLLHSASCMSFQSVVDDEEVHEALIYSDVKLLSKHNDGSLNLWQISFSDANDFSSITGISHSSRFCGHCFHMSGILSHPVLPLSVSTAAHTVASSPKQLSELILWRLDPVGPLSYSGGLSELARVSCQEDHLFAEVAWFALLFPNWSLGIENKSPSTSLIALTENQLQIYQAVVDASQILTDVMTPMSDSTFMSTRMLISQQSSVHPGCILHLLTAKDEGHSWGKIIFLETFSESLFSDCTEEVPKKFFSKYLKKFYVVMLETSDDGSYIHTWKVTFSANLANVKGNRTRKTTVQMMDSSDDESEEEILTETPPTFSYVDVNVLKLSAQKLPPTYNVVDACSGSGKFNVFFTADHDEHLQSAPYHLCTISSGGNIDFWHCKVSEDENNQILTCDWKLWKDAQNMNDPALGCDTYHISVSGIPVLVKAASNALLACMCVDDNHNDGEVMLVVTIYECASSGGSCWKTQGTIKYFPSVKSMAEMTLSNLHLGWLSREEGSFFLAIGYDANIEIYSLAPRDMKAGASAALDKLTRQTTQSSLDVHTRQKIFTSSRHKSTEGMGNLLNSTMNYDQDCEYHWRLLRWTKLTELNIKTSKNFIHNDDVFANRLVLPSPITVSWARDGILIVATDTEIHVFSQWISSQQHYQKCLPSSGDDSAVSISGPVSTKGLSEIAEKVCPSLLQYHPLVLSELMNSGHLDAVREILIHLAVCMNGDLHDNTCQQVSVCLEKYQFCDQLSSLLELCSGNRVTPFPLHKLVGFNGKVNSTFSSEKASGKKPEAKNMQDVDKEPNLDDILAEDERSLDHDDELDEILGLKPVHKKKAAAHIDLSQFEPNYFGKEHCNVIHDFLTRSQLPGLTSLEQMELMALADTLANASNFKQEMADGENCNAMGLSGNERGYAVSGSGATALDTCGLRFIMAVHNHLCLLNSLPVPNRSALFNQGLSTCHFAWAFHSETEEEMLSQLPSVQRGAPEWPELRSFGAAWWIRSTQLLRRLVEKTARAAFLQKQDPLDAALYYLALNKKAVLCGLFRSVKDSRMNTFFQHNFSEERWRRAALKNAFALMGKQRFHHATAFFLLSGSVQDAVKVCIDKLKDLPLAILIVRLREGSDISYHQLLSEYVLGEATDGSTNGCTKQLETDSFERSMAYWILGKYDRALSTLLDDIQHEDISDVFNFYIFLRVHPIVLRNQAQRKESNSVEQVDRNVFLENANEQERHLIFQTAVVHLESGCPVLALDCLSKLPKFYSENMKSEKESMPGKDLSTRETTLEENKPHQSVVDEDWSQPVALDIDDELQLDWSEEEDEEESDDASRPTIKFEVSSSNVPTPVKMEENKQSPASENIDDSAEERLLKQDVFAQHLRLTACFQIFVQELKAIANAYNTDGGQLRSKLYTWLENASSVLHQVFEWDDSESCSEGLNVKINRADVDSSSETDDSLAGSLGTKLGTSQTPSLHELILADNQDWKIRRSALAARRRWLHCHHNFIRTLLSYCILHDSAYGTLATMRMELLLLLQESLQDKNTSHSLASPLPSPSDSIPLVTSSIASCKTVVADPLTYLCHITRDILQATLHFEDPPHPHSQNDISQKCAILCSQSAALSTCIYQSLCDTSTPSARSQLLKADTLSVDGCLEENASSSPAPSFHTPMPGQTSTPSYVTSSTLPSQWPGVALLQSMLNCEATGDNRTKILVLLCESTIAVFFSLLIHSLQTHNTSLLHRLTIHALDSKMWNAVFGGGVKIPIKYVKSSSNLKQLATKNVTKIRERMNFKLLSGSTDRKSSSITSSMGQDSLSYREKFVAPEIGLWDWLLTKPFQIPTREGEPDYDSDAEDDDSEASSLTEDQESDEIFDENIEPNKPETDPDSYSWKIMRYVVVKMSAANFQTFIQLAGFDLAELNTNSPFLSAVLRVLHGWQAKLASVLDEADGPPEDYLQSSDLTSINSEFTPTSRPAMLRYQTMLEPNNTPFTERTKQAYGCRRLWQSLVKKESVQEIFIKYIFDKKPVSRAEVDQTEDVAVQTTNPSSVSSVTEKKSFNQPVKILHKEHELISAFCVNNVNSNCIALSSAKDIQEIDVSELVASDSWTWLDESTPLSEKVSSTSKDDDFLFVAAPLRITRTSHGVFSPSSSIPWTSSSQTGQGANILMKRPCSGIRRMEAHPTLPYYLTGCRDGSVCMWEWGHQQHIHQFQQPAQSSKICNVHFSTLGNKVTSVDADGYLTMWQASAKRKPFLRHQVHDRQANDFCFISSSSVLATAGSSVNGKNVAVWDTLMPRKNILVKDFSAYEQSEASCIKYLSRYRTLLVGGKNGQVITFDDRCLHGPLHKYAAHDVAIKCLAVDPNERFYVTGSSNGDIRLWDSLSHKLLYTSTYAHPRSSLFKNFGSGTVQVMVTEDHLLSCGADGSLKMKPLPSQDFLW